MGLAGHEDGDLVATEQADDVPIHGPLGQDQYAGRPQPAGGLARQCQER